jgi:tRNA threonylcarbamoyl adenosine modification protein (Sua5/YciO/YrdC/YwlC family)
MKRLAIDVDHPDPEILQRIVEAFRAGEVVAYPSDTVYGLGCAMRAARAIDRIYQMKGRDSGNPLLLLAASPSEALALAAHVTGAAVRLADRYWPGPLTLILHAGPQVPAALVGPLGTVAVRCPESHFLLRLLEELGQPITSTSANFTGGLSALDADAVLSAFPLGMDLVVDGGTSHDHTPTTIVNAMGEPEIVRQGSLEVSWGADAGL